MYGVLLRPSPPPCGVYVKATHRPDSQINAAGAAPRLRQYGSVLKSLQLERWPGRGAGEEWEGPGKSVNWVAMIMEVESKWRRKEEEEVGGDDGITERVEEGDLCPRPCCEEEEEEVAFDQTSFSRLLRRVSLAEASLYNRLSCLALLAYSVPKLKTGNLLSSRGFRFVTSSQERRSLPSDEPEEARESSAAYDAAATAAAYLRSQAKNALDEASFVATTNSVTSVVGAKEEVKEAVAKDLNSPRSSPCEWFICDDEYSKIRYFVIQGSESLASWQANLLFEPIQFEGLDFVVHRGIYEAAKGIYEQMLPEVRNHLRSRGKSATLQFTGHSLGGSLSLLVNLMLLIRGEAPASSLLPVVNFGSPTVLCEGNDLLQKLGLPHNHVQAIMMHRDIVPRAFSCTYPDHVAEILKAINRNFRRHSCLNNKKLLYEPMGELLILQPDEKSSPYHHLLPSGGGLFALASANASPRLIQAAQSFFLNSPHPLEILSDRSAYGANGTIHRDHDMTTYVRSIQNMMRIEVNRIRKAEMESRRKMWAALVVVEDPEGTNAVVWQSMPPRVSSRPRPARFAGIIRAGMEPLKRFRRLVASQHVHLLLVMLLPAQVMFMKALAVVSLP